MRKILLMVLVLFLLDFLFAGSLAGSVLAKENERVKKLHFI